MESKKVRDLMISLENYPVVDEDANLYEAIVKLDEANKQLPAGRQHYRAVLVMSEEKKIIGKIGLWSFLKAFEPKYRSMADLEKLQNANLSSEFIETITNYFQLWEDKIFDACETARSIKAKDAMKPAIERIDADSTIIDAMHKIIMWQTLSILVNDASKIIGIIRISDIYSYISDYVINQCEKK